MVTPVVSLLLVSIVSVVVTGEAELAEIVKGAVQAALKKALPSAIAQATTKPYLTKAELMQLTGWSARQVEYQKSKRAIPFIRHGRTVLFPTEEVYAFLEKGRVSVRTTEGKR